MEVVPEHIGAAQIAEAYGFFLHNTLGAKPMCQSADFKVK